MSTVPEMFVDWAPLGSRAESIHWAVGVFDGLHLGHAQVVASAAAAQKLGGGRLGVLTFQNHPATLFSPEKTPRMIVSEVDEKLALLGNLGVDIVLNLPFTQELASLPASVFIERLMAVAPIASISVGEGWHFGAGREGNVAYLRILGEKYGFKVYEVPPFCIDGLRVSSTGIRAAIECGEVALVERYLGRRLGFEAEVIHGRELGRTIGVPTANLAWRPSCCLPWGVYRVVVAYEGAWYRGLANWGLRPSVEAEGVEPLCEVHLFDFDQDLYGKRLRVEFCDFLREERKFASFDELKEQIMKDLREGRQ